MGVVGVVGAASGAHPSNRTPMRAIAATANESAFLFIISLLSLTRDACVWPLRPGHTAFSHRHPPPRESGCLLVHTTSFHAGRHCGGFCRGSHAGFSNQLCHGVPAGRTQGGSRHPDFCPLRPSYPSVFTSVNTYGTRRPHFRGLQATAFAARAQRQRRYTGLTQREEGERGLPLQQDSVVLQGTQAIILPGSQRISCGNTVHSTRPMMMQITNGQTPLMMSAIVTPSAGSADPRR